MSDFDTFRDAVDEMRALMEDTAEAEAGIKLSKEAWSLKEIVGHLIDSASNNHQRFVRLQIGNLVGFPAYEAEKWVFVQQYGRLDWQTLKALWAHYNTLILALVEHIPRSALNNTWTHDGDRHTLEWLVKDYYRHLRWHIEHYRRRSDEIAG